MKNKQSKIKPIKTKKEVGTTCCLVCKNFIHNFKPQEVKMTKKSVLFVDQINQDF